MIHHTCTQNTPEWRALRAGIPTSSQFHRIITPTGRASGQREKYLFQLLGERITGSPRDDFKYSWSMDRGSALERKAVEYFEFQTDFKTEACGFITDDLQRWGSSPDRFVGDKSLLECKVPDFETHLMYLMHEGSAYQDYRVQAQGELFVSERERLWFLSYSPDLPWSLYSVEREEKFIGQMATALEEFSAELEQLAARAKENGWFRRDSIREPEALSQDQLVKAMRDSLIAIQK